MSDTTSTDDERERFEEVMLPHLQDVDFLRSPHYIFQKGIGGRYFFNNVESAWLGWQARAKVAADHLGDANKMVAALSALTDWHEWSLEQSERAADEFYRETGMLAPFKDASAAAGVSDVSERCRNAWVEWYEKKNAALIADARTALASARGES